jgi:hypothetical protein
LPEKALLDFFYFRPSRTRLFVDLPEVEFPKKFDWSLAQRMGGPIQNRSRRVLVERALCSVQNLSRRR